jgi:hypothetical protein
MRPGCGDPCSVQGPLESTLVIYLQKFLAERLLNGSLAMPGLTAKPAQAEGL